MNACLCAHKKENQDAPDMAFRKGSNSRIHLSKSHARFREIKSSQSPDLPPPHGLAPSETMVSDHGLRPPLSTEIPGNKGFSGSAVPIFGFGLADPATKG